MTTKTTLDLPTALVLSRTLDLRPRRRPYVLPSVPVRWRASDWPWVLMVFPACFGLFSFMAWTLTLVWTLWGQP